VAWFPTHVVGVKGLTPADPQAYYLFARLMGAAPYQSGLITSCKIIAQLHQRTA